MIEDAPLPNEEKLRPWQAALVLAVLGVVLFITAGFHRDLVNAPFPLDGHEPAQALMAQGVAQGVDFADIRNLPRYAEVYGPLYPALAGALCAHGWACDVRGQRRLVAALLAAVLALLLLICRRLGVPWLESACVALWAYELLLLNVTPIARPDGLGLLLWLAGLAAPFFLEYSLASLGLASVLFTLAAATKLYFLCGPAALAAVLVLRRPRAIPFFLLLQVAWLGGACAWAAEHRPYLFYGSVLAQSVGGLNASYGYMAWQLWHLVLVHSPGLLFLAYAVARQGRAWKRPGAEWAVYGLLGLAVFVCLLGATLGARLTYLVQLAVLPFLPIGAASLQGKGRRFILLMVLMASAIWAMGQSVHGGFAAANRGRENWYGASAMVAKARHPFVESTMDMALEDRPALIFDSGMARDLYNASLSPQWQSSPYPRTREIASQWQAWRLEGMKRMLDPATDLVLLSVYSPFYDRAALERAGLKRQGMIFLPFPQTEYPMANQGIFIEVFKR